MKRRNFAAALPLLLLSKKLKAAAETRWPVSCNGYNWITFYRRQNKVWGEDWDRDMAAFASTGLRAFEPGLDDAKQAKAIMVACKKYGVSMPSVYINSLLHVEEEAEKSINNALEIAKVLRPFGTKIFVSNPTPIAWGKPDQKTDEQLITQAKYLEKLNLSLKKMGITLSYHTHDMEMKAGAREFHHMMQNTTVSFCMDLHWIYRGSDNSVLPVYDVLKMYGSRISELHVRQSVAGVWSEVFTAEGDIDYARVAKDLKQRGIKPHIVIEQCVEAQSLNSLDAVAAHKADLKEIRRVFGV